METRSKLSVASGNGVGSDEAVGPGRETECRRGLVDTPSGPQMQDGSLGELGRVEATKRSNVCFQAVDNTTPQNLKNPKPVPKNKIDMDNQKWEPVVLSNTS